MSGPVCPICRRGNRSASMFCAYCGYRLKPAANGNGNTNGNGVNGQQYVLPNTNNAPIPAPQVAPPAIPADQAGNIPSNTLLKKRYRIIRKIAQGGMGAVYESTDTHAATGTRWAVKEMSPAALPASERTQAIADFRREAQMLASLNHPNLPVVVETFEEMGKNFLVMEFVAGHTLQNVLENTPGFLAEERVRVWARQLLDVMNYLHSQNPPIVYRDLKPANIMLLEGTERIKLIDFGIARFHKAGKTQDTEAFGTAGYAPPEQYGKGQTDGRSDIYALAATLHYMTTKHDPSLNPFNWLPVRRYNPTVSGQLEAALQTALNLDPQRRFATVRDFAQAVGVDIGPVQPAPAPPVVVHSPPVQVMTPASKPTPAPRTPRQKTGSQKTSTASQPKHKSQPAQAQPQVAAPPPIIFTAPPASVAAPVASSASASLAAPVAQAAVADPPLAPVQPVPTTPPQPAMEPDRGTTSTSTAPPKSNGKSKGRSPALVVSKQLVDLGEAWRNKRLMGRVDLLNVGDGELEGTVLSRDAWLVPSIHKFRGQIQTVELRVRKAALPLGRVELQVPNLFAIIWARARWALPFFGLWLWVLLLVASSAGRFLLIGLAGLLGALVLTEGLMWLWAWHVRLLVPAERTNTGRLLVQSTGGEQQVEVTVKARPTWLHVASGWLSAALLVSAEVGLAVWFALSLL